VLRDVGARRVGRFSFACAERCRGRAWLAGGTLRLAGPAGSHWRIVAGTGRLAGARGRLTLDELGPAEWAVVMQLQARTRVRAGAAPVVAGHRFLARADGACAATHARLAALPPFPLRDFDPWHPDPGQLRQVGAFFTGPGDPRPALTQLLGRLSALKSPPHAWQAVLAARRADLAARDAQDAAALAGDVHGFVASLPQIDAAARGVALSALAAGATACWR
jgi:hypothetical protein